MQDYVSITIGHWVVISLILAVLLVYSCSKTPLLPHIPLHYHDYKETLLIVEIWHHWLKVKIL